jgi:nucleoside-diphosphate-sugar epimerase
MQRVFITGGTGVIAAWAVRLFLEQGIQPITFQRGVTGYGAPIIDDVRDQVIWEHGELQDGLALMRAVQRSGADTIVHLASAKPWQIERPWVQEPRARQGMDQIVMATINVLDVARSLGLRRVVYGSSKAAYARISADLPPDHLVDEDAPRVPDSLYGIGKLAAEQLGFFYERNFGLEFLTLRFSPTFGPLKRGAVGTPGHMIESARDGETVVVPTADYVNDYVYNKDVALGIYLAAVAPTPPRSRAFNLGTGHAISGQEVADSIRKLYPRARIEYGAPRQDMGGDPAGKRSNYSFDISRARQELGYEPRYYPLELAFEDYLREDERIHASASRRGGDLVAT